MGVRLVRYGLEKTGGWGTFDHSELTNRDLPDQHPISAITGLEEELKKVEFDTKDSDDIHFEYDCKNKVLTGNAILLDDKFNDLKSVDGGLYCPQYVGLDTDSIMCGIISKGESLNDIYLEGQRFEHNGSWADNPNGGAALSWYWDENLNSFVQPANPDNFTGFVTKRKYDNYIHEVTLKSGSSDDDLNGVIIGYVKDPEGRSHTLSTCVDCAGSWLSFRWGICYNYYHAGAQFVLRNVNMPSGIPGNWASCPNGIRIKITKNKNIITCVCTNWGQGNLDGDDIYNENTLLRIDLNNYSWGHLFSGRVQYGYCSQSQPYSYFYNPKFYSEDCAAPYTIECSLKISKRSGNIAEIMSDGLYVPKTEISISKEEGNAIVMKDDGLYVRSGGGSSGSGGNTVVSVVTEYEHNLSEGNVIACKRKYDMLDKKYYDTYVCAIAQDWEHDNAVGVVCKVYDEHSFDYITDGFFQTDMYSDYTMGRPLYLSNMAYGQLTSVQPVYGVSKCIGYVVPGGFIVRIERGVKYNQNKILGDYIVSASMVKIRSDGFVLIEKNIGYDISIFEDFLEKIGERYINMYLEITPDKVFFKNVENHYNAAGYTYNKGIYLYTKVF